MVSRAVKTRVCDRCPRGREKKATHLDEPLSLGESKFLLDLCDVHYAELDRLVYSWGRLGNEVEQQVRFGADYKERSARLAELRTSQAETPVAKAVPTKALRLVGPVPEGLPADATEWVFTEHAKVRMGERKVSAIQALRAACTPVIQRPGRTDETMVHEGYGVKVVVDLDQKTILTVGQVDHTVERKAL